MRKILTGVVLAVLLMGLMGAVPVSADAPAEVWIDDDFDSSTTGWGITHFASVQAGIGAVSTGGTVHVLPGIYNENISMKVNMLIQGAGANVTIIDGGGSGPVVTADTSGIDNDAVLDGFTVRNGSTGGPGGGIYISSAAPVIRNCIVTGNEAAQHGGGIFITGGAGARIINCIIHHNTTDMMGGGILVHASSSRLVNCTITENEAASGGGGIQNVSATPVVTNSVIYANTSGSGDQNIGNTSSTPTVTYSCIEGGYTGTGNIGLDPLFVSPASNDYHIQLSSPCTDNGTNTGAPDHDIDGDGRPFDGDANGTATVDIGADEVVWASTYTLTVTEVGNGSITLDPIGGSYEEGMVVTLTAEAGDGWTFSGWSGALSGSSLTETITMDEDKAVTATFTQDEYTLTVTPVGNGSVNIDPAQDTYLSGTVVKLTAVADDGWSLDSWSGGGLSGSAEEVDITMDSDKEIIATFTEDAYTLAVTSVGNGSVNIDPVQATYSYGDIVTLTPVPDDGWLFDSWSGDISGSEDPKVITIEGDTAVTANFTQEQYTLAINIVGNGDVTVDPDQDTYTEGTVVKLTAVAGDGWSLDSWSGGGLSGSAEEVDITMDSDKEIVATFTEDAYTLAVTSVGNGSVNIDPVQATYSYGDIVTLTPVPDDGWLFDSWGGDISGSEDPKVITIKGDTAVTANFTQEQYTLAINIVGNGSVNIDPAQDTYLSGTVVKLTALADDGWSFSGWSGDLSGSSLTETITMDSDKEIVATFTEDASEFRTFVVSSMTINWANDDNGQSRGWFGKWFKKFKKWFTPRKDEFSISGRLELPEGMTIDDLQDLPSATVRIFIGDASGSHTVDFTERALRRRGTMWQQKKGLPPGEGMNITSMTIWWAPEGNGWTTGWSGFSLKGDLELPDGIEEGAEPEATVVIEIPKSGGGGSLVGEETVEFKVSGKSGLWYYYVWPRLRHFRYEP